MSCELICITLEAKSVSAYMGVLFEGKSGLVYLNEVNYKFETAFRKFGRFRSIVAYVIRLRRRSCWIFVKFAFFFFFSPLLVGWCRMGHEMCRSVALSLQRSCHTEWNGE